MKNIIYFGLVFFLSSLLTSCGKKKTIVVKFTDVVTGEGIPNIDFTIRKGKTCLSYDGCGSKVVVAGTTDAQGEDAVTFRQGGSKNYYVSYPSAESFGYYILDGSLSVLDVNDGEIKEIKLLPSCELKTSYNNVNCFDENDSFKYFVNDEFDYVANIQFEIAGCNGYQSDGYNQTSAGNRVIDYTITRNGVTESFSESFYLVPFQENEIVINY